MHIWPFERHAEKQGTKFPFLNSLIIYFSLNPRSDICNFRSRKFSFSFIFFGCSLFVGPSGKSISYYLFLKEILKLAVNSGEKKRKHTKTKSKIERERESDGKKKTPKTSKIVNRGGEEERENPLKKKKEKRKNRRKVIRLRCLLAIFLAFY